MTSELVSSPLILNTGLRRSHDIKPERVASFSSKEKQGFATLTIDTLKEIRDNWTATVCYFQGMP